MNNILQTILQEINDPTFSVGDTVIIKNYYIPAKIKYEIKYSDGIKFKLELLNNIELNSIYDKEDLILYNIKDKMNEFCNQNKEFDWSSYSINNMSQNSNEKIIQELNENLVLTMISLILRLNDQFPDKIEFIERLNAHLSVIRVLNKESIIFIFHHKEVLSILSKIGKKLLNQYLLPIKTIDGEEYTFNFEGD